MGAPKARVANRPGRPQAVLSSEQEPAECGRSDTLDSNLHFPARELIDLRIDHADLDATIDRLAEAQPIDELLLRRLKKRRLALRDRIAQLERQTDPQEPA